MKAAGLQSGTLYPLLAALDQARQEAAARPSSQLITAQV
jgi:hypothetical protein